MGALDRMIELAITVVLIVGGYQFYFWAQRQTWRKARYLETPLDEKISYYPRWVWVYSGLYYPMILMAALVQPSWRDFAWATGCFLALLALQIPFFLFLPVAIPAYWREAGRRHWLRHHPNSASQRFLDVVWSYDKLRNSMPSMHVSMATMVDLTIWRQQPTLGHIGVLFPVLIGISALKTKQHYVVDVLPGALIGAFVFWLWSQL